MIIPQLRTDKKEFTDGRFDRFARGFAKAGWFFSMRGYYAAGVKGAPVYEVTGHARKVNEKDGYGCGVLESDLQFKQWAFDFVEANELMEETYGNQRRGREEDE